MVPLQEGHARLRAWSSQTGASCAHFSADCWPGTRGTVVIFPGDARAIPTACSSPRSCSSRRRSIVSYRSITSFSSGIPRSRTLPALEPATFAGSGTRSATTSGPSACTRSRARRLPATAAGCLTPREASATFPASAATPLARCCPLPTVRTPPSSTRMSVASSHASSSDPAGRDVFAARRRTGIWPKRSCRRAAPTTSTRLSWTSAQRGARPELRTARHAQ